MAKIRVENVTREYSAGGNRPGTTRPSTQRMRDLYGQDYPPAPEPEDLRDERGKDGRILALDGVSLIVEDGETISVVGPSGCGKTTLLRVIAGLEAPDSGRVFFDDQDVTNLEPKDRQIGLVFQNYALYPHMESKQNLAFFFWMHRRDKEVDEKVKITSEILGVGFDDLLSKKPRELSGGQRQRVAIGRCIIRDPKIFLFDEPLSNLDALLRQKTRVEIKKLLNRFNTTSLYVTHDQTEALALADRIAIMRQGRIEQLGTYWQLYDHPKNLFIAGFLGAPTMNQLTFPIENSLIRLPEASLPLPETLAGLTLGQITIGIRPEHLTLAGDGEEPHFRGRVEAVEVLPSDRIRIVHLRHEASRLSDSSFNLTAVLPILKEAQVGENLALRIAPGRVLYFDPTSERNLL